MEIYRNLKGASGVIAFEIGDDYIKVRFRDGIYLYNYEKPGRSHVEQMKLLATAGKGLSTYISKYIRDNYKLKY